MHTLYFSKRLLKKLQQLFLKREGVNDIISELHHYEIIYSIWDHQYANTHDPQYVTIKGTAGETEEHLCDENFNVIGQDVVCAFESPAHIGHYRCISLRTGGSDGIDLIKVIGDITSWFKFYFMRCVFSVHTKLHAILQWYTAKSAKTSYY